MTAVSPVPPQWRQQASMRSDNFRDWTFNFASIPDSVKADTNIGQQEGLIREAKRLCEQLVDIIHGDVLSVQKYTSKIKGSSMSTVGIMLTGCQVDNLLIGGPACNSGQLEKGDLVVSIDGNEVTDENIHGLLVGEDKPGSTVMIAVQKARTGQVHMVKLERIASAEIADRRRLFELFTALKTSSHNVKGDTVRSAGQAFASSIGIKMSRDANPVPFMTQLSHTPRGTERDSNKSIDQLVDDSIALWSKMVKEEEETKAIVMQNVICMQDDGYDQLEALKDVLRCECACMC